MDRPSPFAAVPGGVAVNVRLTPKASRDRVGPVAADEDGGAVLKIAVTQPPEKGQANRALIKLVAKSWRLPRTAVSVRKGAKDRRKTLFVEGDAEAILARLGAWTDKGGG